MHTATFLLAMVLAGPATDVGPPLPVAGSGQPFREPWVRQYPQIESWRVPTDGVEQPSFTMPQELWKTPRIINPPPPPPQFEWWKTTLMFMAIIAFGITYLWIFLKFAPPLADSEATDEAEDDEEPAVRPTPGWFRSLTTKRNGDVEHDPQRTADERPTRS